MPQRLQLSVSSVVPTTTRLRLLTQERGVEWTGNPRRNNHWEFRIDLGPSQWTATSFHEASTTLKCPTSRSADQINFFYICHFLCVMKEFEVVMTNDLMRTVHTERASVYFSSILLELLGQLFRLSGENQTQSLGCSSESPSELEKQKVLVVVAPPNRSDGRHGTTTTKISSCNLCALARVASLSTSPLAAANAPNTQSKRRTNATCQPERTHARQVWGG